MKTGLLTALVFLLGALASRAHVGSPDVFFEGRAGTMPVRVVIRPPATLPGLAQVDVHAIGVSAVFVQAAFWDAGKDAAPEPLRALPVANGALFHTALWLLRSGSYSIQVTVESPRGRGTVAVPLNSAATQRPVMPPALGATLAALGGLLFFSAVWLAQSAARAAGVRAGKVACITTLVIASAVAAGAMRWQKMDRDFREKALSKPIPVVANIRAFATRWLLHLTPPEGQSAAADWDTLVADHGKLMHLFLIREPDFDTFAHLHPVRRDPVTFEAILPPLPAGAYRLYGEITHDDGLSQTLMTRVIVPSSLDLRPAPVSLRVPTLRELLCGPGTRLLGDAPQPFALDPDDSWRTGVPDMVSLRGSPLEDGGSMLFLKDDAFVQNRETTLRFRAFASTGTPAAIQPYMGMRGHVVVRRTDGAVFTHLHPGGTISMAGMEVVALREALPNAAPLEDPAIRGNEVSFPYAFPLAGDYRLWVQIRTTERVLTGVFDAHVASSR